MLIIFSHWSFYQELYKLNKRRFFLHKERILGKLFLIFLPELGNNIGPIHGIIITTTELEISLVVLQLVHVCRHHPFERMPHYKELERHRHELLIQVFGEQRILFSQKGMKTHPIVLQYVSVDKRDKNYV